MLCYFLSWEIIYSEESTVSLFSFKIHFKTKIIMSGVVKGTSIIKNTKVGECHCYVFVMGANIPMCNMLVLHTVQYIV